MKDTTKYEGIIPAFYACYDAEGSINPDAVRALTRWFIEKGVKGVYVGGSSDEQLISGLVMGATGGIGGTYGAMPELYVKLFDCVKSGDLATALEIQNECCRIIYKLCSGHGNMYGMIKEAWEAFRTLVAMGFDTQLAK